MTYNKTPKSPAVLLIICFLMLFIAIGLVRSIAGLLQKHNFIADRKAVLEQEKKENEALKKRLEEVQTPEFIEHEARERLGMSKEGETIILMDKSNPDAPVGSSGQLSNWQRWWKLFF